MRFEEDRYLEGRAEEGEAEPALVATAGQSYLYYGKGALAMNALATTLGREALDTALARLVRNEGGPTGGGSAEELAQGLEAVATSQAQRAAVDEWFRGRVVDDFKVDSAVAVAVADGYHAEVRISGRAGAVVEFAIYGGDEAAPKLLATGNSLLGAGENRLSLPLTERPRTVVLDPSIRRIDLDRSNNGAEFEIP
jgi:hypothetical protein